MCHERWSRWWMRQQAREEGRRVWDLFDRETRDEPPQPIADTQRPRDDREPVAGEPARAPVVTGRP